MQISVLVSLHCSSILVSILANSPFPPHLYWVLASSTILLHRFISSTFVFNPCIPRNLRFFSTLSRHLRLALAALLVPMGLEKVSFLNGDVYFALVRCPSHLSLLSLTVFTTTGALYKSYGS